MEKIDIIYKTLRNWLLIKREIKESTKLAEACDFGDSYGFCFESDDKFSNVYWCIDKKTNKLYSFRPNEDVKKFLKRKVLNI